MTRRDALHAAFCVVVALSTGCATVDPRLPMRLPEADHAVGLSTGLVSDLRPLLGLDYAFLDGNFGLDAGVSIHGEADVARVSVRAEGLVWYGVVFGLGARLGWLTAPAFDRELAAPEPVRPPRLGVDLTALVALPLPVWGSTSGAWFLAPYARPGLRVGLDAPSDRPLSGFTEFGLMLRWTTFSP